MRVLRSALLSFPSRRLVHHEASIGHRSIRRCRSLQLFGAPGCSQGYPSTESAQQLRELVTSARIRENTSVGSEETTIYALSTAPGRAAIAIIRLSGPACIEVCKLLCPNKQVPKARHASFRQITSPLAAPGDILDPGALVLYFPAPNTTTGEDVLELHVHGGPAIVKSVLGAIGSCSSKLSRPIRYAEPGEFTRRAFLNDRLSLPEVEALGDTLSAVTEEQRRLSVQGTTSNLGKRYEEWREMLLHARGELEALIDFSEDQHFDESPNDLASSVAEQVKNLVWKLELHSSNAVHGELLRSGIGISLIGSPNVGKSSLLNQIVGRNAAIVSREAGTTRDIVEVGIDLGGFYCRLGDTAGLRKSKIVSTKDIEEVASSIVGEVEQEGIRRAKAKALESDVVIVVLSIESSTDDQGVQLQLDPEVVDTTNDLLRSNKSVIIVINKMDRYDKALTLAMGEEIRTALPSVFPGLAEDGVFFISCQEAESVPQNGSLWNVSDPGNLQQLLNGLTNHFRRLTTPQTPTPAETDTETDPSAWQESLGVTTRQRGLLNEAVTHLRRFLEEVKIPPPADAAASIPSGAETAKRGFAAGAEVDQTPDDLAPDDDVDIVVAAESLRAAADSLARITGRGAEAGDVEEVLGVVFEK